MPDKTTFRAAVLESRPDLAGKMWCNRLIHDGRDYTVTVRGVATFFWIAVDEPVDVAVRNFFAELSGYEPNASHP